MLCHSLYITIKLAVDQHTVKSLKGLSLALRILLMISLSLVNLLLALAPGTLALYALNFFLTRFRRRH